MSQLKPNQIYLSRGGKVFGPYTYEQIDSLRRSGELMDYAWQWDPTESKWAPLHHEPPAPEAPTPAAAAVAVDHSIQAVCFTSEHLMGGPIEAADQEGFSIYCETNFEGLGPFYRGQSVRVNLVDDATGRSESLVAVVSGCRREDRGLHYRFAWKQLPALLSQRSQSQLSKAN